MDWRDIGKREKKETRIGLGRQVAPTGAGGLPRGPAEITGGVQGRNSVASIGAVRWFGAGTETPNMLATLQSRYSIPDEWFLRKQESSFVLDPDKPASRTSRKVSRSLLLEGLSLPEVGTPSFTFIILQLRRHKKRRSY